MANRRSMIDDDRILELVAMTEAQIKKLSTHRLLNVYRMIRKNIFQHKHYEDPAHTWKNEVSLLERLKAELDNRENVE